MRRKKRQGLWIVVDILILVSYHILYRNEAAFAGKCWYLGAGGVLQWKGT